MITRFISIAFILAVFVSASFAQIEAPSGPYTSDDGRYTVTIKFEGGNLTVVEPNKTSVYTPAGEDVYEFTNPVNGKHYKIQVEDKRTLAAFGSTGKTKFYYTGNAVVNSPEAIQFYKEIADRYEAKMKSDARDAQLWSFCSAAATQRWRLNDQGFEAYAKETIASMRLILEDQSKCPCADAIPPVLWIKYRE
ncbi:MAG TPA: hypothetical protein VG737_10555 [Cyclobacteriaceae bacterium]|nr:hypothetical protein [Cyclobacteriaceae bacterium]